MPSFCLKYILNPSVRYSAYGNLHYSPLITTYDASFDIMRVITTLKFSDRTIKLEILSIRSTVHHKMFDRVISLVFKD